MGGAVGLPYMGSKNKIAADILAVMPKAERLYDLFCGGCAITHSALLSRKYNKVHANDIGHSIELFKRAMRGEYEPRRREWVTRERFFAEMQSDPFLSFCWSFGYNGREYLYSKEIEPYKEALFQARINRDFTKLNKMGLKSADRKVIIAEKPKIKEIYIKYYLSEILGLSADFDAMRKEITERTEREKARLRGYLIQALKKSGLTQAEVDRRNGNQMSGHYFGYCQWEFPTEEIYRNMQTFMPLDLSYNEVYTDTDFKTLQIFERLEKLDNFERLECYSNIERVLQFSTLRQRADILTTSQTDYRNVPIEGDSVIYCDPPYKGTAGYQCGEFDHENFYAWCLEIGKKFPIFISEYDMPEPFVEVWSVRKLSTLSGTSNNTKTIEKLYTLPKWAKSHNNNEQLKLWS